MAWNCPDLRSKIVLWFSKNSITGPSKPLPTPQETSTPPQLGQVRGLLLAGRNLVVLFGWHNLTFSYQKSKLNFMWLPIYGLPEAGNQLAGSAFPGYSCQQCVPSRKKLFLVIQLPILTVKPSMGTILKEAARAHTSTPSRFKIIFFLGSEIWWVLKHQSSTNIVGIGWWFHTDIQNVCVRHSCALLSLCPCFVVSLKRS